MPLRRWIGWAFIPALVESLELISGHRAVWSAVGIACYVTLFAIWCELGPWQSYRAGPLKMFFRCTGWRSPAILGAMFTGTVLFFFASVLIDLADPQGTTTDGIIRQLIYAFTLAPIVGLFFLLPFFSNDKPSASRPGHHRISDCPPRA